jgi:CRISPR-associated protein Cmr6
MSWEHLPRDTRAVVQDRLDDCRNLGLILDRFNPWAQQGNRWDLCFQIEERRRGNWNPRTATGGEAKGLWLSDWRGDSRRRLMDVPLLLHPRIDSDLLAAHYVRWAAQVRAWGAEPFSGYTESRLVVGLGADSVLETALTLHRIYGYPFIPGSALKGVSRLVALLEVAGALGVPALPLDEYWRRKPPGETRQQKTPLNKLEALLEAPLGTTDSRARAKVESQLEDLKRDPALPDDAGVKGLSLDRLAENSLVRDFRAVFGSLGQAGEVVFFDGVPPEPPELVPDVMNPHYPEYYQGEGFPHDGDQPIPISFLAVAEGVRFDFAVASRRRDESASREVAGRAQQWLGTALLEVGIGAKTGAGYGLFSDDRPVRFATADEEPTPPPVSPDPAPAPSAPEEGKTTPEPDDRIAKLAEEFMRRLGAEE